MLQRHMLLHVSNLHQPDRHNYHLFHYRSHLHLDLHPDYTLIGLGLHLDIQVTWMHTAAVPSHQEECLDYTRINT